MAFAVAYKTPNIWFWRSLDRRLKKNVMEPAGRCSNLSAATRVIAGSVCVRQICSVNSLSLSRLSPLFPLVS